MRPALLVGLALFAGLALSAELSPAQRGGFRPPPSVVVVEPVVEREIRNQLQVLGTVEPWLATTVSAEVAGLAERADPEEGDYVKGGKTVLVQLKRTDRRIDLQEAKAALARALQEYKKLKRGLRQEEIEMQRAEFQEKKALMEKYESDLKRAKRLFEEKVLDESSYITARSDYLAAKYQYIRAEKELQLAELGPRVEDVAAARAEVERYRAQVRRIQDELRKTTIRSPVSGFLVKKHIEVGQWVKEGGAVADIINIDKVYIRAPIMERNISEIRVGDEATIRLDALPGQVFRGRIKHINPQADPASRTFPVQIEVVNTPDFRLKSGMFARVTIEHGDATTALLVPKDAVMLQGSSQFLYTVNSERARMVRVRTGRSVGGLVEVLGGGLKKGDPVIVVGNEKLRPGAKVIVRNRAEAPSPARKPRRTPRSLSN
ncbi:MAG: efflux RND transporter periplasmic adaptor subunit [Nitrospinota bacterium]